jgi:Neurotransmitter-gated ion-channel ligand binding domain
MKNYLIFLILLFLKTQIYGKKNPETVIKEYIMREDNNYTPHEVPRNGDRSPLVLELELDIKGVLEVDIVQGILKILGAFRATYLDKKLSWENYTIEGIGRKNVTCKEAAQRMIAEADFLKYYPDSVNCVNKIVTRAQTSLDGVFSVWKPDIYVRQAADENDGYILFS